MKTRLVSRKKGEKMKRDWTDEAAESMVVAIIMIPILIAMAVIHAAADAKARREAEEAARVYVLPDDFVHV